MRFRTSQGNWTLLLGSPLLSGRGVGGRQIKIRAEPPTPPFPSPSPPSSFRDKDRQVVPSLAFVNRVYQEVPPEFLFRDTHRRVSSDLS